MKLIKELPFSQLELKELLTYDKDTGLFRRKRNGKLYIPPESHADKGLYIEYRGKATRANYLAFYYEKGYIPDSISHINGDIHDNAFSNLKDISHLTCNPELTHELLHEVLHYNKLTGDFSWLINFNKKNNTSPETITNRNCKCIRLFNKLYLSHRLAWFYTHKEWPDQIDHIDHNPMNNAIGNIRNVSDLENKRNKPLQRNNTSGTPGVSHTQSNKWRVRIKLKGDEVYLGLYSDKKEAIKARKDAEVKYGFHKNCGMKR